MIKILFVCHGNICRSPMAEFVLKDMAEKCGIQSEVVIESSATSYEEIGNPVHNGTKRKLAEYGISVKGKYAKKLLKSDYDEFDYFIGMDSANIRNMKIIFGGDPDNKIYKLLEFAGDYGDIADPWYTGNFDETYKDVYKGCTGLIKKIKEEI
ncbi:MAG: low molecular weight phosphotyrosine protein phosphatase [Clostridiales bacterium]|nr:low molecular weight phosphotyrosine protein phosphatase [Clostridiales bacterium]